VKVVVPRQWLGLNALLHTCLRELHDPFHGPWSRPLVVKVVVVLGQCLAKLGAALAFCLGLPLFGLALDLATSTKP